MSRKIVVFPNREKGYRGTARRWGVRERVRKEIRLVLINGTGSSGTKYISKVFQAIGMDMPHERTGADGSVTHYFHTDHEWYPMFPWYEGCAHVGERRSDYIFENEFLAVRHPLKVIASMTSSFDRMDFEFLEETGVIEYGIEPKILRAMNAYYYANAKMEKSSSFIFQLETMEKSWSKICKKLGIGKVDFPIVKVQNRNTGYRAPKEIQWEDIEKVDSDLTLKIKKMARRYKYEV